MARMRATSDWWAGLAAERYWCEVTDRDDIGVDLKCPQRDLQGKAYWSYDLIRQIQAGDLVFHYQSGHGLVGASLADGAVESFTFPWKAHSTAGRTRPDAGKPGPGWRLRLRDLVRFDLSLDELRRDENWIRAWMDAHPSSKVPFQVQGGRLRGKLAYLTKFPAEFVGRWGVLAEAATKLGVPPLDARWTEPTADPAELRKRVQAIRRVVGGGPPVGNSNPERTTSMVASFKRLAAVVAEVLRRAQGKCESCNRTPFLGEDGEPFLEVHHVRTLAEGGADTVDNAVALCPNCHRALHHAHNREALREALRARHRFLAR